MSDDHAARYLRVRIAQMFPGWTLDYIDSLHRQDVADILAIVRVQQKIEREEADKVKRTPKR